MVCVFMGVFLCCGGGLCFLGWCILFGVFCIGDG